ncbi:dermatopontin-like [Physella acuta]|uniref:dermatopontin-like n=1 Tax=Physella acuta TaxID=109671 RepID=UPI0027DB8D80|nr:dermatopontin-like [Physella acuta]
MPSIPLKMNSLRCVLLSLLAVLGAEAAYLTNYDQPFDFICPSGQALSYIASEDNNFFNDRVWEFRCRKVGATRNCAKSGYVNEFDLLLAYVCPDDYIVTGVESYSENFFEDRRFKFQCCQLEAEFRECSVTDFLNKFDEKFAYTVPAGYVIRGAFSAHNDVYEDRMWKLNICKV